MAIKITLFQNVSQLNYQVASATYSLSFEKRNRIKFCYIRKDKINMAE